MREQDVHRLESFARAVLSLTHESWDSLSGLSVSPLPVMRLIGRASAAFQFATLTRDKRLRTLPAGNAIERLLEELEARDTPTEARLRVLFAALALVSMSENPEGNLRVYGLAIGRHVPFESLG